MKKLTITILGIFMPLYAHAAGFSIMEKSSLGMGYAYAGNTASPRDASTIYTNPAGAPIIGPSAFSANVNVISPVAKFTNNGSVAAPATSSEPILGIDSDGGTLVGVPNLYAIYSLADVKLGLAINSPFGMGVKYDDAWVGRYFAIDTSLITLNVNPSFSYNVGNKWSIGLGMNFTYAKVDMSNAIDLGSYCYAVAAVSPTVSFTDCNNAPTPLQPQAADGMVEISGDNNSALGTGFNFGVLYRHNSNLRIGLAYRSKIKLEFEGDADFQVVNGFDTVFADNAGFNDSKISAETTLPASASLGIAYNVNRRVELMADFAWTGWSVFEDLRISFESGRNDSVVEQNWEDAFKLSLGINFELNRKVQLRSGIAYDQSPVPSEEFRSPRIPDSDRTWFSIGASYLVSKKWRFDGAVSYVDFAESKVNNFNSEINNQLIGEYESSAIIAGLQMEYTF